LHLVKIFPSFYGTRRFITAFTSAKYLSLFWASAIQFITPHPTSRRSILLLSFHLRQGRGFGGILVSMLASDTQDCGFAPGRSHRIFRAKKSSACLPSEGN
jgi:hypothetical protein